MNDIHCFLKLPCVNSDEFLSFFVFRTWSTERLRATQCHSRGFLDYETLKKTHQFANCQTVYIRNILTTQSFKYLQQNRLKSHKYWTACLAMILPFLTDFKKEVIDSPVCIYIFYQKSKITKSKKN